MPKIVAASPQHGGSLRVHPVCFVIPRADSAQKERNRRNPTTVTVPVQWLASRDKAGQFNWPLTSDHVLVAVWRHFRGVPRDASSPYSTRSSVNDNLSTEVRTKSPVVTIMTSIRLFKRFEIWACFFACGLMFFINSSVEPLPKFGKIIVSYGISISWSYEKLKVFYRLWRLHCCFRCLSLAVVWMKTLMG